MYQEGDRRASFAFLRRRFPDHIPAALFFYGHSDTRIWFGGRMIHAVEPDRLSRC